MNYLFKPQFVLPVVATVIAVSVAAYWYFVRFIKQQRRAASSVYEEILQVETIDDGRTLTHEQEVRTTFLSTKNDAWDMLAGGNNASFSSNKQFSKPNLFIHHANNSEDSEEEEEYDWSARIRAAEEEEEAYLKTLQGT